MHPEGPATCQQIQSCWRFSSALQQILNQHQNFLKHNMVLKHISLKWQQIMLQCSFFNVIIRSLPQCTLPTENIKIQPKYSTFSTSFLCWMLKASHFLLHYVTIFTSQGCTFPQTYLLFQIDVHALPVNLHNCFPSCLVCPSVSQFLSLSFYHVHRWAPMFLICSKNNIIFQWLLAYTLFLICSSLWTSSFYHVYQETTVFLIFFPLPVISFCHDYQQASMFLIFFPNEQLQFFVFTVRPQQCGIWECSQIYFQFWKFYFLITINLCAC